MYTEYPIVKYLTSCVDKGYIKGIIVNDNDTIERLEMTVNVIVDGPEYVPSVLSMIEANAYINKMFNVKSAIVKLTSIVLITDNNFKYNINIEF